MEDKNVYFKDPGEKKDYSHNWTPEMVFYSDTISSSTWVVLAGDVSKVDESSDTMGTTVWLDGGTEGTEGLVENTILTTGGRRLVLTKTIILEKK